mgnify:CR=1 FL=1|jgi:hypothetical protein
MRVNVVDYGPSKSGYYVTYKVTGIDSETRKKLEKRAKGELTSKNGDLYIKNYFEKKYFPFGSEEAQNNPDDFVAREEIEMMVYLTSLLED